MKIERQIADSINLLTPEKLQYMCKLVCLVRFCPGFNEGLNQLIPDDQGTVSPEQLAATDALMDKWLNEEGWAEILRSELARAGVQV